MKHNLFTRTFSVMLVAVVLTLSLPLTAFAADETEPQYSIIHTPDGGTISVDPNVVKVDEISGYLFEDPLGSSRAMAERMSRSATNPDETWNYTVTEGDDFWIQPPTNAVGTVTWTVSNSFLASVDSSGMVYVNTAGAFYVLANFTDTNGNAKCYKYNFVIELSNGVYKFKNKANNMYIELSGGNIAEGTEYILWQEESNRNSEFKITDVGAGVYTIRSMVANHVGMSKSSNDRLVNSFVDTGPVTDPNNEAYIVDEDLWGIASSSQGYYIYNITGGVAGRYTITPQTNENPPTFALDYLIGNSNQYWTFVSVVANKHGVDIVDAINELAINDSYRFEAIMYSSYYNTHGQHGISWSVTNGTGSAIVDPSTGILTGKTVGNVTLTATYYGYNSSIRSKNYVVNIIQYSPELVYKIKNTNSSKYLEVYESAMSSGSAVCDMNEDNESNQLWSLKHQGNGYYKIYPMHISNRVLGYNSNNDRCELMVDGNSDNILWLIENTSNGSKIVSKADSTKCITNTIYNYTNCSVYNSAKSQWIISEFINDTYWEGDYTGHNDTVIDVVFTVDSVLFNRIMSENYFVEAGKKWDNISSKVNVKYVPYDIVDNCIKDFLITIVYSSENSDNILGITFPNAINSSTLTYSDWDCAYIVLYANTINSYGASLEECQAIVTHEIGHALKLCHCREESEALNTSRQQEFKSTFPALMQPLINDVNDIVYTDALAGVGTLDLTEFDKSALIAKWGK